MRLHCDHEQDLLDAVAARRWPDRADPAVREHVGGCTICSDVAEIATAFFMEREHAHSEAAVPPASLVWWRSQIRAREESARLAVRPIALVQAVATASVSDWVREMITTFGAGTWWASPRDLSLSWMLGAAAYATLPLLAVGMWIVIAPVVVYFALDD
jgi:predicted anti-sigma-YlaC factor YlaD